MPILKDRYFKMWEDRGLALVWIDLDAQKNKRLKEISSYGRNKLVYLYNKGFVKCFTSENDWEKERIMGEKFFSNYALAKRVLKNARSDMKGVLSYYKKLWRTDLAKLSDKELISHLNKVFDYYSNFLAYFEISQPQRTEIIEKKLKDEFGNVSIEAKDDMFIRENKDWKNLVRVYKEKGLESKETNREMEKYLDKYMFFGAFETFKVLDRDALIKRLKQEKIQKDNKESISSENKKPIKNKLVDILSDYAALRSDLSQYWTTPIVLGKLKLFKEISRRSKIKLKDLELMLREELNGIFKGKIKNPKIKDNKLALVSGNYRIRFYYNDNYQKIKALVEQDEQGFKKGVVVNKGIARGVIKVISSEFNLEKQFPKFKKGDILVTQMTTPNYLPILRQASGIITDEGGMLSHAAIVSRELNLPCIVGTKNATKLLKDEDFIELNANEGIIKILKKK